MALLLLVLMPLGLLHRSSTGGCRAEHQAAVSGSVAGTGEAGLDASSAQWPDHGLTVGGNPHDEHEHDLPLEGAPVSLCGPGAIAPRPALYGVPLDQGGLPAWRATSPLAHATPPPAPPPRLT